MVEICKEPEILLSKARPAVKKDGRIAKRLEESLIRYNQEISNGERQGQGCIGMAADMIGEDAAVICVLDAAGKPLTMMNPVIVKAMNEVESEEGCLCHEGTKKTRRYTDIVVEYRTPRWAAKRISLSGIPAIAVQHEMDHLNGILI